MILLQTNHSTLTVFAGWGLPKIWKSLSVDDRIPFDRRLNDVFAGNAVLSIMCIDKIKGIYNAELSGSAILALAATADPGGARAPGDAPLPQAAPSGLSSALPPLLSAQLLLAAACKRGEAHPPAAELLTSRACAQPSTPAGDS